jgi:competence ComEA-like helix-hairpin-helix protein
MLSRRLCDETWTRVRVDGRLCPPLRLIPRRETYPHTRSINPASAKELHELPGLGPTTPKAIIQFRTESGLFHRVEDLLAIRGIWETKLSRMRPWITIGGLAAESFIRIHQRFI